MTLNVPNFTKAAKLYSIMLQNFKEIKTIADHIDKKEVPVDDNKA
jgi:hypothetical protein